MGTKLRAFLPILLDLLIPTCGYYLLHWLGMSDFWALTIAGAVTAGNAVLHTVRQRQLDAVGVLVVIELAASIVLIATTRDPRIVLLRPSVYIAVAGVWLLLSCVASRPMSYVGAKPMATKGDPQRAEAYERAWRNSPRLRRIHRGFTAVAGGLMLVNAAVRAIVVLSFAVPDAVLIQEVPGVVLILAIVGMARLRVPVMRRIVDAEQERLASGDTALANG
jgi:hypothetical protein